MIAWFARNHVAANLLMLTLLFLGITAATTKIPLEVFPSLELNTINISIQLRGASPLEMEESVAIRIEEAIQDLDGIEQLSSASYENSARVSVDVKSGTNSHQLLAEIERRVDAINHLPSEIEKPIVTLQKLNREVITVAVIGESRHSEKEIRQIAERVQDELLSKPEISQIELEGVRDYQIAIEINEARRLYYNLTLATIEQAIRAHSINQTAGNLKSQSGDILLSTRGEAFDYDSFAAIPIMQTLDDGIIQLRDIATLSDAFEETPIRSRFNGQPAAFIDIYRTGDESAIRVADTVKRYIDEQQSQLPAGIELRYWRDRSLIVKKRLRTLMHSAAQGSVLVFILLTLFLRPTIAFWVFIGIPIAFMGAFISMVFTGTTLNIISLFGFILVLGIVVDDAIVTGENIYSHQQRGGDPLQASILGTKEIAIPVTFGILTTVVAFLPILFVEGTRGKFFAQIPAVVIPILLFSLIESKLILPAHLKSVSHSHPKSKLGRWISESQTRFAKGFEHAIMRYYPPLLTQILHYRYTFLVIFIGILLVIITLLKTGWMGFTFFPKVPSEFARATLVMPAGTDFELTDRYVQRITEAGQQLQKKYNENERVIRQIQSISGSRSQDTSSSKGYVALELTPPEDRQFDLSSKAIVSEWRKTIGELPGIESLTFRAEIGHRGSPIDIEVRGQDLSSMQNASQQIKQQLAKYPFIYDINDSLEQGKKEIRFELTPLAIRLGFTRRDITQQIRRIYHGVELQTLQRGRHEVRVVLRHPKQERQSLYWLGEFQIESATNEQVALKHLIHYEFGTSPTVIQRTDRFRTLNVMANLDKDRANMISLQNDLNTFLAQLNGQYPGLRFIMRGEIEEQAQSLSSVGTGLIGAFFAIYCLLAIPFKSYTKPFIVIGIIPFSLIGAVLGHFIMGMGITVMSIFGMLALMGVVVNDGLVLVDFINQQVARSSDNLHKAISSAGSARFRPVMLTSLTTFFGLLPLLFEQSTQAQFLIPMAVSLGFGILFATLLTLFLVPINYLVLEDIKRLGSIVKRFVTQYW